MIKKGTEPTGLQLATLSGNYEAARAIIRHLPMDTISTTQQLSRAMIAVTKNKEALRDVFTALDRLDKDSRQLGATTLIRPQDHPLVSRTEYVAKPAKT